MVKIEIPKPIQEALVALGPVEWPYQRSFKIKPKKWWWRLWPKMRRLIRAMEKWANSKEVAARIDAQVKEKILTGQWKMTELDYHIAVDPAAKEKVNVEKK